MELGGGVQYGEKVYLFHSVFFIVYWASLIFSYWFQRLDCCRPRSIAIIYSFLSFFPFFFFVKFLFLVHWRRHTEKKTTGKMTRVVLCVCFGRGMIRSRTVLWARAVGKKKESCLSPRYWSIELHGHTEKWTELCVRVLSPRKKKQTHTKRWGETLKKKVPSYSFFFFPRRRKHKKTSSSSVSSLSVSPLCVVVVSKKERMYINKNPEFGTGEVPALVSFFFFFQVDE